VLTRTTGAGNPGKMAGRLMREVKTGEENRRILGTGVREGVDVTTTYNITQ